MSFLQNLGFRQKFGLIAALALVMLSIPSAMFLQRVAASLGQIDHEIAGLPPAKALVQVARLSAQHRGLSNAVLNGDATAQPKREQLWQTLQALRPVSEQAVASLGDENLARRMAAAVFEFVGRKLAPNSAEDSRHQDDQWKRCIQPEDGQEGQKRHGPKPPVLQRS